MILRTTSFIISLLYYSSLNAQVTSGSVDSPVAEFKIDSTIELSRFKKDNEYVSNYGARPHFYINDPEKKFLNCKQVTYVGVVFSYMKLVSERDLPKAGIIKEKYLPVVAYNINHYENMPKYRYNFFKGKETIDSMDLSVTSYKAVDAESWVTIQDYKIEPGKIPAIIRHLQFPQKEGIGAIFVLETCSKTDGAVSGYWVILDFADRKTLLMDYIIYSKVHVQSDAILSGWPGYWVAAIHSAGVYEPVSFQKYLELEKKGQFEMISN
ncbi:MAG: hypothetical protein V4615_09040 [Bacteroidota bacterium]